MISSRTSFQYSRTWSSPVRLIQTYLPKLLKDTCLKANYISDARQRTFMPFLMNTMKQVSSIQRSIILSSWTETGMPVSEYNRHVSKITAPDLRVHRFRLLLWICHPEGPTKSPIEKAPRS